MNVIQTQIIKMISAAINGYEVEFDLRDNNNWMAVIEEATEHQVSELIYSVISCSDYANKIDKTILEQWKKTVFLSVVRQLKHINQTAKVLNSFNEQGIPVIALKGLIIREFYPNSELRTMSDADILVHEEDLHKVSNLMLSMGYIQTKHQDDHGAHIVFEKENNFPVEVHWTLINKVFFKGDNSFEASIWQDAMNVRVGGADTLSLSLEDLAVHLCVHMAIHISHNGFGIRQLCDLVLLIKKKGSLINWNRFVEKIQLCRIEKFTIAIFKACEKLFNVEIPGEVNGMSRINDKVLDSLIDDIFNSGVYGNKNSVAIFANEFAFNKGQGASKTRFEIINKFIKLLFPPINEMNEKYRYAKKFVILTPVAWIHHLFEGIFNKEYSTSSKTKIITSTVSIAAKRNKLLKQLEL